MANDTTPHLSLPLPHPENLLEKDVERLREALGLLDASAAAVSADLAAQRETSAAQQAALERQEAALSQVADEATQGIRTEAAARQTADAGHDATLAALTARLEALAAQVAAINIDPWDVFPPRVPIAVDGVQFGGSDGRRAIMPGETTARENWLICDGGSDGKGGTVPLIQGRVILGASDAYPAGSTGGSATHRHSISGTVGATTLSVAQMTNHTHSESRVAYNYGNHIQYGAGGMGWRDVQTGSTGGSQSHTHSLATSSGDAVSLPPYSALAYIMRTA